MEAFYLLVIRVMKRGPGFMNFKSESVQALAGSRQGRGWLGRWQAYVIVTLSLGVGQSGQIGTYLISVNIGTYCELLSG